MAGALASFDVSPLVSPLPNSSVAFLGAVRTCIRYGLHVAKGADEQLADWPTVPAEQDLPHQAVVGLLEVCAEGSDWPRKYRIIKTMALKERQTQEYSLDVRKCWTV